MFNRFLPLTLLLFTAFNVNADFAAGGDAYKRGDFAAAAKEFRPLAERGDHRAMYALGSMYAAGLGVDKDLNMAFELFDEAAKNGRIDAMYKLGLMYEEGLATQQDYRKALRYYQKSARQGYPLSQYRFGLMYARGKGVSQNPVTASAWLIIAGHYFIYESGKTDNPANSATGFAQQILFTQQQELDRITRTLVDELQALKKQLTQEEIELVRKKVIEFEKYKKDYHSNSVKNINANGLYEKLFLPDTLQ